MKTLLWLTVPLALLAAVLAGPIPEHHNEGFFVSKVNNSAVCVVNRTVYQDEERLPMENPCEICRCRPPGFACAYVRCSKKDPKPGCNIVELVGHCCPQYRCEKDPAPEVPQPEASSIKPDILKDDAALDPLLVKDEDPIDGKIDKVPPSTEANVDGHAAILESSTPSLDLDQRAAEEVASSSKPDESSEEELGKSLEESSSAAPEIPREERIETNEILADDANANSNASEPEEGGRNEQLSTLNPVSEEGIDARSQEGAKNQPKQEQGEKVSVAPLWNEEMQSTQPPEKIERKEDLLEGASSAAPLPLSIELRHAEEQQSSVSPLMDEKIELSAASSEPSLLNEKSVEDKQNITLLDEPKIETLPLKEEKLDITVLKGDKLPEKREKRETIEILEEKEVNPVTSEPQATETEMKEKSSEKLLPEVELKEKELLDEPQEVQPSSQAPVDKILIAETLSKGPDEKVILTLANEAQLPEGSSSVKPSLSQN